MKKKEDKQTKLVFSLLHWNKQYSQSEPSVTDRTFNQMEKELRELSPSHPYFKIQGPQEAHKRFVTNWELRRCKLEDLKEVMLIDKVKPGLISEIIEGCQQIDTWFDLAKTYEEATQPQRKKIIKEFKDLVG